MSITYRYDTDQGTVLLFQNGATTYTLGEHCFDKRGRLYIRPVIRIGGANRSGPEMVIEMKPDPVYSSNQLVCQEVSSVAREVTTLESLQWAAVSVGDDGELLYWVAGGNRHGEWLSLDAQPELESFTDIYFHEGVISGTRSDGNRSFIPVHGLYSYADGRCQLQYRRRLPAARRQAS